jgi:hypothetical protein
MNVLLQPVAGLLLQPSAVYGMQGQTSVLGRRRVALHGGHALATDAGLTRHRRPGSVGGRGSRLGAGRTPRAGAAAQAA